MKSVKGVFPAVIQQFKEYIYQQGDILLESSASRPEGPKSSLEFVNSILDFHAKNMKLIKHIFDGDSKCIDDLYRTCNFVIINNPNPAALNVVRYLIVN